MAMCVTLGNAGLEGSPEAQHPTKGTVRKQLVPPQNSLKEPAVLIFCAPINSVFSTGRGISPFPDRVAILLDISLAPWL
jgi:hypothetical protein